MYNSYFDFNRRPFASVPQVDHYFPAAAIEAARATLARCIERGEGAGFVVGPSGTGKTILCQMLAEQFRDLFQVVLLSCGRLSTRRNLLQAILYGLGRPYREMDEGELRLALVDYITLGEDCPQGIVLLVDEAHTLPLRALEELRMLTNVAVEGQPRVRLVLAGSSLLEERFASPKLDSFSQRLVGRCYLESFNRTETQSYIFAQIDAAGGASTEIFSPDACRNAYQATDGVPRLINQVCDHALLLAYAAGRRQLEGTDIEEAWANLQQLPTPWNGESAGERVEKNVIEFGCLDELSPHTPEPAAEESFVPSLRISAEDEEVQTHALDPAEQLKKIERMLTDVEEEFQPAGSIVPEVELVFDEPEHLLKEEFEEEEVVTDRYAKGDDSADRSTIPSEEVACETEPGDLQHKTLPLHDKESFDVEEANDEDMIVVDDDYEDPPVATRPIVAVPRQQYGQLFAKLRRG